MIESTSFRRRDQVDRWPIELLMASFHELIQTLAWPFEHLDDVLERLRQVAEQAIGREGARLVRVPKDVGDGDTGHLGHEVPSRQSWTGDGRPASITLQTQNRVVGYIVFPDRHGQGWTERQRIVATLFRQVATSCLTLAEERMRTAEMTDALEHRATHDQLTGLPNRRLLLDRLSHALLADARKPGLVAVMFIDIDRFKELNDRLDHAHGDKALVCVARQLSSAVRAGDTVGRLGGDEFLVICEDLTGSDSEIEGRLRTLGERLQRSVGPDPARAETDTAVSISIGVSIGGDSHDPEELIRRADRAMYVAKEHGGGQVMFADPAVIPLERRRRLSIERSSAAPEGPVDS